MERGEPNERRETSENLAAYAPPPRREPERPMERRSFEVPQERTERAAEPPRPQPTFTAKPAQSPKYGLFKWHSQRSLVPNPP